MLSGVILIYFGFKDMELFVRSFCEASSLGSVILVYQIVLSLF